MKGDPNWRNETKYAPTPMDVKRGHARRLLYLRTVDKIMTALVNEYGADADLPKRAEIQDMLDRRNAPRKPYGGNMAAGCEL